MGWTEVKDKKELRICEVCSKSFEGEEGDPSDALCEAHSSWEPCGRCDCWVPSTDCNCHCPACVEALEAEQSDDEEEETKYCWNCGGAALESEGCYDEAGDWTCNVCYYPDCVDCGVNKGKHRDEMATTCDDGEFICDACLDNRDAEEKQNSEVKCGSCGETVVLRGTVTVNYRIISYDEESGKTIVPHDSIDDPREEALDDPYLYCTCCGWKQEVSDTKVDYV